MTQPGVNVNLGPPVDCSTGRLARESECQLDVERVRAGASRRP